MLDFLTESDLVADCILNGELAMAPRMIFQRENRPDLCCFLPLGFKLFDEVCLNPVYILIMF